MTREKHREQGTRYNLGMQQGDHRLFLERMSAQPRTHYRSRKPPNPSWAGAEGTQMAPEAGPLPASVWRGHAEHTEVWRAIKAQGKAERGAKWERWGRTRALDLHHRQARRDSGQATTENAALRCRPCHVHTPTFGDHSRLQ
jgi:hypothetical protein